jgi:hypothetical protein
MLNPPFAAPTPRGGQNAISIYRAVAAAAEPEVLNRLEATA